jgi:hypothetical protein
VLDLDFAFFNMRDSKRQGLASRKLFLDRLAPLLFPPRVERLINFDRLGLKGCNVTVPLGEGNWSILNQDNRGWMIERTGTILNEYELPRMGVDRRLKGIFDEQQHSVGVVFGDHFITALAAVLVDKLVASRDINKLVLVGEIPDLGLLINNLSRYHIPISVQNYRPSRYEIMVYRLLYEEGLAISNSNISPHNWGRGDLVVSVEGGGRSFAIASPEAFYIKLDDERCGLAPELEKVLTGVGMNSSLCTLAPILETCMLAQAGNINHDGEENVHKKLIKLGDDMGLWEPFLDKGL